MDTSRRPQRPDHDQTVTDLVVVHDDSYVDWVFDPGHPTQGRRFVNGLSRILRSASGAGLSVSVRAPRPASLAELLLVHTDGYVREVLDDHVCDEWDGPREDLAALARLFVGGTLEALELLLSGHARTAVHLPGAKHHAQADHSSGFCVFADFAIAARTASDRGWRVAVLDIDAHHGDGTENLTAGHPGICTVSIHQQGIFPGTGLTSDPARHVHNLALPAGAGDPGLHDAVAEALGTIGEFQPDLILLAAGADGHADDPLSSLGYATDGYRAAGATLRQAFPDVPVLIGGAGGYRPDDTTPEVWAAVVTQVASEPEPSAVVATSTSGTTVG